MSNRKMVEYFVNKAKRKMEKSSRSLTSPVLIKMPANVLIGWHKEVQDTEQRCKVASTLYQVTYKMLKEKGVSDEEIEAYMGQNCPEIVDFINSL